MKPSVTRTSISPLKTIFTFDIARKTKKGSAVGELAAIPDRPGGVRTFLSSPPEPMFNRPTEGSRYSARALIGGADQCKLHEMGRLALHIGADIEDGQRTCLWSASEREEPAAKIPASSTGSFWREQTSAPVLPAETKASIFSSFSIRRPTQSDASRLRRMAVSGESSISIVSDATDKGRSAPCG